MDNYIDSIYSSFFSEMDKIARQRAHIWKQLRREAKSPRMPNKKLPRSLKAAYLKAGVDKSDSNIMLAPYMHEGTMSKYSSDNYMITGGPLPGAYYGGIAGLGLSAYQLSKVLKEHGPKVKKNILLGAGIGGLAGLLELLSKRKKSNDPKRR